MKSHRPLSRVAGLFGLPALLISVAVLWIPACRVTDLPLWGPAKVPAENAFAVEKVRNILYVDDKNPHVPKVDPVRHRLDIYIPKGVQNYPVVMLVHGGTWIMGDNRCCGLYSTIGEFLAGQGIGAVLPNYRLSPAVKHPEHVKDVARAFAWTRAHIAEYGGRSDSIFLVGHSAGGHLVSLLTTDERYLKAEGLRSTDIKGVVSINGVYEISAGKMSVNLGGDDMNAFRLDEMSPFRGENPSRDNKPSWPGIALALNVFAPAFGNDPKVREDASPLKHVRPGLPPFLIVSAVNDLPTLPGMAVKFHQALVENGCAAELLRVENRNHNSTLFRAITTNDPVARATVEFVRKRS
jgi:acetyl esterase/lipase